VMQAEGLSSAREAVAYLRGRGEMDQEPVRVGAMRGGDDMSGLR